MLNQCYVARGNNIDMFAGKLYYDPTRQSASSTLEKLAVAIPKKIRSEVRVWLKRQDAYTFYKHFRKRCLRNPYTETNVMDVCE